MHSKSTGELNMEDMIYTPDVGERLEHAVDSMLIVANANDCVVKTCWNGIEVVVRPGDNLLAVIKKFDEDLKEKVK